MIGEEDGRGCKGVWKIADGARMHPRKRNDRAIEYECTRKRKQGEHYVKKDKYFYKKMIFLRSRLM